MKKFTSILTVASGLALAFALSASPAKATSISGSINFNGEATTDTGDLSTATAFTSITGTVVVPAETGSYASIPTITPVTFTPFSFSAAGVTPLWTLTVGGITYSFDATSIQVVNQNTNFLNISGTGVASITGFADTSGTWSITDTMSGGSPVFVFGAATTVGNGAVPDSGTTAMMIILGLAGVGVGLLARRHSATAI